MTARRRVLVALAVALASAIGATRALAQDAARPPATPARPALGVNTALGDPPARSGRGTEAPPAAVEPLAATGATAPLGPRSVLGTAQTVAVFALVSLLPVGVLIVSAFVRISVVLALLRQALGSPQVPGNQVLTALSVLLTVLVMWPVGERVYERAIAPYAAGTLAPAAAWEAGSAPIKAFMIEQICRGRHEHYLTALYAHVPRSAGVPEPTECEQFPLRVVAPAFLLSELTTALFIGFAVYLPFLVVDLVVSAVLAAMGLFMLPPALVALPLKLVLFALADGWVLVADMLLRSFGAAPGGGA